ncbi:MAG: LruC domain-containing protein [Prevotella sp.]|jgi:LruC domain-containing protein|nr:LruC domain-containing protein [Prevotella sp.]
MKTSFAYFALLVLTLLTACSEQDYYDPSSQKIPEELSDLTVPTGFDWTTSSQIALNLDVDDQYNGAYYYKVQIFDSNPIITPGASLLAEGLAKKNEPFKAKITYAKSDSILYVQETDPSGNRSIKAITVSSNSTQAKVAGLKSDMETKSANLSYTVPTKTYATPSNAIVISGSSPFYTRPQNGISSFVIPAGQTFEGALDNGWYSDVFVYVEGTWKNTASSTSLNNIKLIIQNGGKYMPAQETSSITVNGTSKIVVATTGQFNPEKKTVNIEMNNESPQVINNSLTFNINNISNIKDLFNYGTMSASGTLSTNTSGVQIINEGSLTTQALAINGANIINTCKFVVNGTASLADATVNVAADKLFKCSILKLEYNNTIALDSRAILDVTNELQFNNNNVFVKGPESGDKALLRLEKFSVNNWSKPTFSGYLQIESSDYPESKDPTSYYILSNVEFVRKGESTVNIPSTDCNAGGNVIGNNEPTTPRTYPMDVTLGDTYSYAFEDNYPGIGDYDMNDFVLDVKLAYTLSAANKVSKLDIKTKVRAIGASKRLAAAIQLDGVLKGNIKSVTATGTLFKGDVFSVTNGIENNQNYAVLPITDDAHALFGVETSQVVNTRADKSYLPAKDIVFSVTFNNPVDISTVALFDMLNVFIINGGYNTSNRKEVHLRGYNPTEKATDLSSGKNYSSSDFVYAIRTPKSVKYPLEWTKISDSYPQFKTWVLSNGQSNPDWYNTYQTNKVYLLEK